MARSCAPEFRLWIWYRHIYPSKMNDQKRYVRTCVAGLRTRDGTWQTIGTPIARWSPTTHPCFLLLPFLRRFVLCRFLLFFFLRHSYSDSLVRMATPHWPKSTCIGTYILGTVQVSDTLAKVHVHRHVRTWYSTSKALLPVFYAEVNLI